MKFFNGEARRILVVGSSISREWPLRLMRKIYRYTGTIRDSCPITITNVAGSGVLYPHWVEVAEDGTPKRTQRYQDLVIPVLSEAREPVITLTLNAPCPTKSFATSPYFIASEDDEVAIVRAAALYRVHAQALLADGATRVYVTPLHFHGEDDSQVPVFARHQGLAFARVETLGLPGFRVVWGQYEQFAEHRDLALDQRDVHPNQIGDELTASLFFSALLRDDGREVPAWVAEENAWMLAHGRGKRYPGTHDQHDVSGKGYLAAEELATLTDDASARYFTPWKPQ